MRLIKTLGGVIGWHTREVAVREQQDGRALLLTAICDGREGGHVRLLATQPGYVYLHSLYVEPRCRGKGVGRMLMSHALTLCQGRRVELAVSASLAGLGWNDLVAWYERLGFQFESTIAWRGPRESDARRMAREGEWND